MSESTAVLYYPLGELVEYRGIIDFVMAQLDNVDVRGNSGNTEVQLYIPSDPHHKLYTGTSAIQGRFIHGPSREV